MNPKMSIRNKEEIFEDFQLTDKSTNQKTPLDIFWNLPKEIGAGSIQKNRLRTGFELYIADFKLCEPLVMNRKSNAPVIGLNFALSGSTRNRMQYSTNDDWVTDSGQSSLYYVPASNSSGEAATKEPVLFVSIQMEPWFFNTLLEREIDRIPADFADIASGSPNGKYLYTDVITPLMQAVARQIINCPYQGLTRQLYLEGKAYELIAYKLEQSLSNKKEYQKTFTLRPHDIERVHHARELVSRDFQDPPKLLDLARAVGLPHPKLNFCFREVYGTTIFGYLRETRLNKAKSLLDDGRMNVTEVAYAVGYSSLSHFARTFKDYFGTAPGNYLREVSHRW
jgi:AraC-like DNA-binding protein